jgi:hypothetical protein
VAKPEPRNDKEEACYALVTRRQTEGAKDIRHQVSEYWLNYHFLKGNQWLYWNTQMNRVDDLPRDADRVHAVMNRLWPDSRTIISKASQRELTFEVLPTAADDATLRGAALSQSVLDDVRIDHDWEKIRVMNLWATWKGGTGAISVDWDPKAGSPITNINALEDGDKDKGPVFEGDTVETPLSLSEFIIEPGARDPERARWWIKVRALPPEEVQATYGLKEKPDADSTSGLSAQQSMFIAGDPDRQTPLTLVRTYYERPNGLNPEGKVAVIVGEEVVHDGKWPFPFKDRLNIAITYETEMEDRWAGDTVLSQARSIQVSYNAAHSSVLEHMKRASNARLAVPHSAMDLADSFTDEPGEIVPYADGMAIPSWVSPPQMPAWWSTYSEELKNEIDDLLGVHDVSRGRAPVNIESGYGLSILAEQDNTPVGKMAKSMAGAWSRVACMVLEIYGNMVTEKRQAIVSSPGQPPETADWTGKDLLGQYRATIPLDAVMPRSRAAQMQVAKELAATGFIQPGDIETFSVIADLPDREAILERMKPDVAKARRVNHKLAIGQVCIPATFDDHEAHLREHNTFRKSERWERLPSEVHELFEQHMQAHSTMAAEAMGQSRLQAEIDPMTAAIPRADSRPIIPTGEMPPEAVSLANTPGAIEDLPAEPFSEETALIEQLIDAQNPNI